MHARRFLTLSLTFAVAACTGDTPGATGPGEPFPERPPALLTDGSWALDQANGQALPAQVAQRTVNGEVERVYVDSAFLDVRADGRWTQRFHTRTVVNGVVTRRDHVEDAGFARREASHYRFSSVSGSRSATVDNAEAARLEVTETLVLWVNPEPTMTRYVPAQPTRPTDPAIETWRAIGGEAGPLPSIIYRFPDEPHAGAMTQYRVDSAVITLRPDGRYTRRTWASEWYSPDFRRGAAYTLVARGLDYDHGTYVRTGAFIAFGSEWIENLSLSGEVLADGRLRMQQGLTPGDPLFALYFAKP